MSINKDKASAMSEGHYAASLEAQSDSEVYDAEFEDLIRQVLTRVGEDPRREGLLRTPLRVAKAMDFLTSGYDMTAEDVVRGAVFTEDCHEMVIVRDIEFYSLCEHHMLPFYGKAHVGYIPNGKIIGLSKVARIVDVFARRLQVQERLTNQIAEELKSVLETEDVAVIIDAKHLCVSSRGVEDNSSSTVTTYYGGKFNSPEKVRELQQYIHNGI